MAVHSIHIDNRDQIPAAIARMHAAGAGFRTPLLQGLYRGTIAHLEAQPDTSANKLKRWFALARRPEVLLVGDDGDSPCGPAGWPQAVRMLSWARWVIIHGAAGRADEYYEAIATALLIGGKVLFIETSSAMVEDWRQLALTIRDPSSLHIILPASGVHPVPLPREKMQ